MRETDESLRETAEKTSPWPVDPEAPSGPDEAPEADVADQRREAREVAEEPPAEVVGELPLEANPADAIEQRLVVTDSDEQVP